MKTCEVCGWTWDPNPWWKRPRCIARSKAYEPSPDEIRQACAKIQADWSKAEERKRRQVKNPAAETAVVVRVTDHMRRNQEID
jgi:hypothetical protein